MFRFIRIVKGHYNAGIEHYKNGISQHEPTMFECIKTTVHDYIYNSIVELNGSYIVYTKSYKPHITTRVSFIVSQYVPIEDRGKNIMSKLMDMVDVKPLVFVGDDEFLVKYKRVGTLYISRYINDT